MTYHTYGKDKKWHIDTVFKVLSLAGDDSPKGVIDNTAKILLDGKNAHILCTTIMCLFICYILQFCEFNVVNFVFGFVLGCEDESSTNELRMYVVQLSWKILKQKSWPNIILQLVTWVCSLISYVPAI